MYFFSGDETCLKVMPACLVISVKRTSICELLVLGELPILNGIRNGQMARGTNSGNLFGGKWNNLFQDLWGCLTALFLFQLLGNFKLVFTFDLAPGGKIGPAQLIMDI